MHGETVKFTVRIILVFCNIQFLGRGSAALAYWDCGFESRRGHECLSLLSVVFFQVQISASGSPLVQRSPNECGMSEYDLKLR